MEGLQREKRMTWLGGGEGGMEEEEKGSLET